MARWGNCDYKQLEKLKKRLEQLQSQDYQKFCQSAAKELAARLLAKAIRRTPVGQYPASSGKKGGTLRRGWTAKTEAEAIGGAGKGADALTYAQSLKITRAGNLYQIEIVNPVNYASYMEYGHRTVNGKGWVEGQFMLTVSEMELDKQAQSILDKKLIKFLGECFNG